MSTAARESVTRSNELPNSVSAARKRKRHMLRRRLLRARLFRTSAFRHALVYATLFSALSAATLSYIYWSTREQIRAQVDERLRIESDILANLYDRDKTTELTEAIQRRNQIDGMNRFYTLLVSSGKDELSTRSEDDLPMRLKSRARYYDSTMGDEIDLPPGSARAFNPARVAETRLADGPTLKITYEITDEQALLAHTFALVVGAILLTVLFSLVGAVWIGTTVLRRIDSVNRTATEIMSGDLSQRLRVTSRDDEYDEIATKLNQMLNRIEDLMKSIQQVTNNVAHDLRSPLTRLRNRLEVTLLEDRDPDSYRTVMNECIGDADSLIKTFNAMLSIARLEAGLDATEWSDTNIGDLVDELAELYQAVAEEDGKLFHSEIHARPMYYCNPHLICQAITNLLDNANKYTGKNGLIALSLRGNEDGFAITVADNGPGIPATERDRVVERFVRLENERNTPGNGLGLSLVQAALRLHGARLEFEDNEPGLRATMYFTRRTNTERHAEGRARA